VGGAYLVSAVSKVRRVIRVPRKYQELVMPTATAAAGFPNPPPIVGTGPYTMGEFVDKYILPDFNVCQSPGALERRSVAGGGRAVYVALTSESILSSAPAAVQALKATLVTGSPESYAIDARPDGDCWLIANRTEGLRHATMHFLRLIGVHYVAAHPAWTKYPESSVIAKAVSSTFAPAVGITVFAPNGGIGNHSPTQPGAVYNAVTTFIKQSLDIIVKQRNPKEKQFAGGDGGTNITFYKQHEYRQSDRSMLGWWPASGIRGVSDLSGVTPFPDMCFLDSAPILAKICATHHGTTGTGSYPTAPVSSTPWTGISVSGPACTIGVNDPPASPLPQTGTNPSAGDYASFAGGVKLFAEQTRDAICEQITAAGADLQNWNNYYVSISPNDGPFMCRCDMCWGTTAGAVAPRERSGGLAERKYGLNVDTTDSDLVAEMGNTSQAFLNHWFQNSTTLKPHVSYLAYADHSEVPSIPMAAGIALTLLPQTFGGASNRAPGEIIDGFVAKSASNPAGPLAIGMQYSWSLTGQLDVPTLSPRDAGNQVKSVHAKGIRAGFVNQTTNSMMAMGCVVYVVSELSWDMNANIETLIGEYFEPLGAAAPAIRAMYERGWDWFELAGHEIGLRCLDVQAAQAALSADPKRTALQQTCLDHEKMHLHWLRLAYEFQNAQRAYNAATTGPNLATFLSTIDAILQWAWSLVPTMTINADTSASNIYHSIPATGTGTAALLAKWDTTQVVVPGFASVALPSTASLTALIAADLAAYPPIPGVTRRSFGFQMYPIRAASEALFEGTPLVPLDQTGATNTLINTIRMVRYYQTFRFTKGASDITFHLQQAQLGAGASNPTTRIRVLNNAGQQLMLFEALANDPVHFVDHTFVITGIPAGDYTLEFNDTALCNGNQYLQWPQNVTLAQINLLSTSPYEQLVRLYFYVPLGETKVVMSALLTGTPQFRDSNGVIVATTQPYPRNYVAVVPSGQSGKVWSFDASQGINSNNYIHFENCPNLYFFDPLQALVPRGLDGHF
jgi:hypothetical protein